MPTIPVHGASKPVVRHKAPAKRDVTGAIVKDERGHLYGHRWREARLKFLARHPLCQDCKHEGIRTPATEVDHMIPHRGDLALFWNKGNWQGLCKTHHSRKTATENGGFGNTRK